MSTEALSSQAATGEDKGQQGRGFILT